MHPLVIRDDAITGDQRVESAVEVPRPNRGVRLQPSQQRGVVHASVSLIPPRRGTQADQATRAPKAGLLRVAEPPHRLAPSDGASHFFATSAFNAWMSSVCSATICFSRRFSSSSCLSRCISLSSIPPYLAFHL